MSRSSRRALPALALLAALALPSRVARADDWDVQTSLRLQAGGGAYVLEADPAPWPLFELGLRGDLLLGEARAERVRFGPAVDLRTEDFRTLEVGGGLAVLWPLGHDFAFTTTFAAGWGARPEGRDGAFALAQLAFGWRPYDYFSPYAWTAGFYVAGRAQLENGRAWEITLGVEVDTELVFAIPVMLMIEGARADDPE